MLPTIDDQTLSDIDSFLNNKDEIIRIAKESFSYDLDLSDYSVDMVGVADNIIHIWFSGNFDKYVVYLVLNKQYPDKNFKFCKTKTEIKNISKYCVYCVSKLQVLTKYNQSDIYNKLSEVYDWLQDNSVQVIKRDSGAIVLVKS